MQFRLNAGFESKTIRNMNSFSLLRALARFASTQRSGMWRQNARKAAWMSLISYVTFIHSGRDARAADSSAPNQYIKLSRPVPFIPQSTNGTCWLACAAMVCGYYGEKIDEKAVDQKVREITLSDRGGQLKATKRECLIALAQQEGLQELILHQTFVDAPADVTNEAGSMVKGLTSPTLTMTTNGNREQLSLKDSAVVPTNQNQSWLLKARTVTLNPVSFVRGKIEENVLTKSTDSLVDALKNQQPVVIVCSLGKWTDEQHAMVVTGVTLSAPGDGGASAKPEIISVDVLDPASDTGAIVTKPAEYLKVNLKAVFTKPMAEKILQDERNGITIKS